ncbi:biotin synthase BioB [Levyella massiliensis]|uniref:biotin synthase BioB n=1 Tax=Levyella massiliensis TaxID=938289 RepID=UPI0023F3EC4C|nr:biotin synthase BioB [Levyella massiliensis]
MTVEELEEKVLRGDEITREEALFLYDQPLKPLTEAANRIRKHFCGNRFDLCTIINAKSGNCPENCKFCAQSAHSKTQAETYGLLPMDEIVEKARSDYEKGVLRYSLVTSGRRLTDEEVDYLCEVTRRICQEVGISVCASLGLCTEEQYRRLRNAGMTRIHNNLETSRNHFKEICTTHSFDDKCEAIRAARAAGMSICSGGIVGLGESVEDRIDMAISLRELQVKSVPVNMLNPIPGTPLENLPRLTQEDMERIVAVYRFLLPDASIRLAGGRGLMQDKGRSLWKSGANATISGDMLTTQGITVAKDLEMLDELGYEPGLCNDEVLATAVEEEKATATTGMEA